MTKPNQDNLKQYAPLIGAAIKRLGFIPEGIERDDLFQEGQIALWQALEGKGDTIEDEKALRSYLYTTIRNHILDYLRKHTAKKRQKIVYAEEPYSPGIEDQIEAVGDILEIQRLLGTNDFQFIVDQKGNGLTLAELGQKYNMTDGQVRSKLRSITRTLNEWSKNKERD